MCANGWAAHRLVCEVEQKIVVKKTAPDTDKRSWTLPGLMLDFAVKSTP
jgi:hypothetical protein